MALPTNGDISVNDILLEMGRNSGSRSNLQELAARWKENTGKSKFNPPHAMSDWRGESWIFADNLSISPDYFEFQQEGDTFYISVNCQNSWTVSVRNGAGTTLQSSSGNGNGGFTIIIASNNTPDNRTGQISVTGQNEEVIFNWSQRGDAGASGGNSGGGGSGGGGGGDTPPHQV